MKFALHFTAASKENVQKLDGVGPVDNRPSTAKLNHIVPKKEEEKKSDM